MESYPTRERFLELAGKHAARGETEKAVFYYNRALKLDPGFPEANIGLAALYIRKAEEGAVEFYRPAAAALRRAIEREPVNEAAHGKLLLLAFKTGTLDAFVRECAEKVKAGENGAFYAGLLKQAAALSVMGSEVKKPLFEYRPAPFIKSFFDLMVLPGATLIIAASQLAACLKPFLSLGVTMFLFYCLYRGLLRALMNLSRG